MTKRPLMFISLSFVVGICILSFFESEYVVNCALFLILVLSISLIRKTNIKRDLFLIVVVLAFLLGCFRYEYSNIIEKKTLYNYLDSPVTISAEIISDASATENSFSFIANVKNISDGKKNVILNEKVRLSHYIDENDGTISKMPVLGDIIKTEAKFKIPNSAQNTGGFDYARYLKSEGIFFQGEIDLLDCEVSNHINRPFFHGIENFRKKCIRYIDSYFPVEEAGVLRAFVVGDRSGVSEEVDASFSKSGISHVLAISGLHISVFISLIVFLLKLVKTSKRKEMLVASIATVLFVLFTGASVSAIRAGMLAVFTFVAKLLYRKSDSLTVLSIAAALLCIFNPNVIHSASFMLSFGSVAGIIIFYDILKLFFLSIYKKMNEKSRAYKIVNSFFESLAVGLSAQIIVVPILIYIFNSFSLMSIFATMAVSIFLDIMLAFGLVFLLVSFVSSNIAAVFGFFLLILTRAMMAVADIFSSFAFSEILYGELTLFSVLLYALTILSIVLVFVKNKKIFIISMSSLCILSVSGIISYCFHYDLASVSFINVGQGDCALIEAPGDCDILIDAGGYSSNETVGEYIIAPYLLKKGVTDIEYLIFSHIDTDHTIGLKGLMETMKVKKIIMPYGQQYCEEFKSILKLAEEHKAEIEYFTKGDILKITNEISISALLPDAEQFKYSMDLNDTGNVLKLDYGENTFIFSGDISSKIEKYLLEQYPAMADIDVLKVPHHGSKNSNSIEFLEKLNPKYAYISVGKNNYGHPSEQTIENLAACKTQVYRADIHKDVTFYFDESDIKAVKYDSRIVGEGA